MEKLLFLLIVCIGVPWSRGQPGGSVITHGLDINGTNVCYYQSTFYKQVKVTFIDQTVKVVYFKDGWGSTKSKMVAVTVMRERTVPKQFPQKILMCCNGWIRQHKDSTNCTQPVCGIACRHGGVCVAPDKCKCQDGYEGKYCQQVINDCKRKDRNKCEQVCTQLEPTGHVCSCRVGWRLKRDKLHCADINECSRKKHPVCSCEEEDGVCKAICNNTPGSYNCNCNKGYRLTSANQCRDIDECLEDPDLCDQICENMPGTYTCKCRDGFMMNKTTNKCDDINECLDHNGGCSDKCNNLIGSYVCTCPPGFYLGKDRKTCKLIEPSMLNKVFCQSDLVGELNCQSYDEKIMIIDAFYGRLTTKYCQHGNYTQDVRCMAKDSPMKYLRAACDNQASCVVFLDKQVFGDPCPAIEKYMQVTYDCMK